MIYPKAEPAGSDRHLQTLENALGQKRSEPAGSHPQLRRQAKGHLPRLAREHYQAFAVVFWTLIVEPRTSGWLNDTFHRYFRELLLHAAAREGLFTPVYCLMPDHMHLIWMGTDATTDQLNAMLFLRKQVNRLLGGESLVPQGRHIVERPFRLQHQAHDHVLRESERLRNAFANTCHYILQNPVRKQFVRCERDWPYAGAVVPGYPTLWPLDDDYWPLFWKLYEQQRGGAMAS